MASSPLTITIDTTPPAFNFTPNTAAFVGVPYTCQVTTSADSAGAVTYQLTSPPAGMTINAATGLITWTPTATQVTSGAPVIVVATDPAGNTATKQFTVKVVSPAAPVLTAASPFFGNHGRQDARDGPTDELHQRRCGNNNANHRIQSERRGGGHCRDGSDGRRDLGLLPRRDDLHELHFCGHGCGRLGLAAAEDGLPALYTGRHGRNGQHHLPGVGCHQRHSGNRSRHHG